MATRTAQLNASLIGQRLIESGYITQKQLDEALTAQRETGLLLGEICLLKGWFTHRELERCLPKMRSRLGERLMSLGYITIEQLWIALLEQRHSGEKLGEILIARGWLDRTVLEEVVAVHKRA
ncbi:MAG TPA: hypothetical protein V6C81_01125 [Planktothrix sp.]|jgi:nitrogen fixation protein